MKARATPSNPHRFLWLVDPLSGEPSLLVKPMFGCRAIYLEGQLVLCLADKAAPWRGVLVPMEREQHAALIADFHSLSPHPVLPKWLYLPEDTDSFETDATALVGLIRLRDPRIGVTPAPRKRTRRYERPR